MRCFICGFNFTSDESDSVIELQDEKAKIKLHHKCYVSTVLNQQFDKI